MSDDIVTRLREYDFMRDGDTPDLTMAAAADEIERLRAEKFGILAAGNLLLKFAVADSKCQCRREWVCHRCQAIDAWKSV